MGILLGDVQLVINLKLRLALPQILNCTERDVVAEPDVKLLQAGALDEVLKGHPRQLEAHSQTELPESLHTSKVADSLKKKHEHNLSVNKYQYNGFLLI